MTEKKSKETVKLLADANNHQTLAQTSDKPRNRPTVASDQTKFANVHEAPKPFHMLLDNNERALKTPIKASSLL